MSPRSRETEAIVIDCRDHGEADIINTIICRDIARVSAIAKGAKRSQKRFVNKLELFTFLHITYSELTNSSLLFLSDAELYASFINLRKEITLYTTANVIRECILLAIRDGERDENLFRLIL
ncbi:MAG: DNA repair protein RecO [Desulfobulbaceae bacterium]|nr:MAG: DNA repair protein RecO [Desulfobulbaceae bacterium]